jgi:hypothetical protein
MTFLLLILLFKSFPSDSLFCSFSEQWMDKDPSVPLHFDGRLLVLTPTCIATTTAPPSTSRHYWASLFVECSYSLQRASLRPPLHHPHLMDHLRDVPPRPIRRVLVHHGRRRHCLLPSSDCIVTTREGIITTRVIACRHRAHPACDQQGRGKQPTSSLPM